MNRVLHKALLLVSACVLQGSGLVAQAANKTYYAARNELQQSGRSWAMSAPHALHNKKGGRFGVTFDATIFHGTTDKADKMAQYFGAASSADLSDAVGTVQVKVADATTSNALHGLDVDHTYDLDGGDNAPMGGTLNFAPKQERTGVMLQSGVDLGGLFAPMRGWELSVSMPIVQMKNQLGLEITGSTATVADGDNKGDTGTVAQFFAGTYTQTTTAKNTQAALTRGRVDATTREKTGLADLKIAMAYNFSVADDSALKFHGGVVIPTGNRSTGVDLFEAVHGNNHHIGALAGAEASLRLWQNEGKAMSIWLGGSAEYTYLFKGREVRLAGLFDTNTAKNAQWGWGQYQVAIQNGVAGCFPLANKLALDMNVIPGSHLDGVLGLTFAWKNFHVNGGYNFFYRQKDSISLATQWPVDRYGIPARTAQVDAAVAITSPVQNKGNATTHLSSATVRYQVDHDAARSSDQMTHSFVGGIGFSGKMKSIGISMNIGGGYEFAQDTTKAFGGWNVYGRLGFSF